MTHFLFYFFSIISVLSAIFVITAPKPTRALLSLILTLFSIAVLYLMMGAYFVAMTQIIVYAGAVLVLFLFVIMMQGTGAVEVPLKKRFFKGHVTLAAVSFTAFLAILVCVLLKSVTRQPLGYAGTTEAFGLKLFTDYLLPFELTSLLLLIGVFAAVSLVRKEKE